MHSYFYVSGLCPKDILNQSLCKVTTELNILKPGRVNARST